MNDAEILITQTRRYVGATTTWPLDSVTMAMAMAEVLSDPKLRAIIDARGREYRAKEIASKELMQQLKDTGIAS